MVQLSFITPVESLKFLTKLSENEIALFLEVIGKHFFFFFFAFPVFLGWIISFQMFFIYFFFWTLSWNGRINPADLGNGPSVCKVRLPVFSLQKVVLK